ncbi:hypothetical protein F4861DRAFT_178548 [Xylaria intraflava]|nr:hypothetical protein F4861DRAFT_178548 [Xylaria intraflava]
MGGKRGVQARKCFAVQQLQLSLAGRWCGAGGSQVQTLVGPLLSLPPVRARSTRVCPIGCIAIVRARSGPLPAGSGGTGACDNGGAPQDIDGHIEIRSSWRKITAGHSAGRELFPVPTRSACLTGDSNTKSSSPFSPFHRHPTNNTGPSSAITVEVCEFRGTPWAESPGAS